MGNGTALARKVVLVMTFFFPVMVGAQAGPPAGVAHVPDTLSGLDCSNGEIVKFNGIAWVCATDDDTLAGLNCNKDQIAKFDGTEWVCADDPSEEIAALKAKTKRLMQCLNTDRYVDLGDTVFDCQTWLEWEKKLAADDEGGNCADVQANRNLQCVNNRYTWDTGGTSYFGCAGPHEGPCQITGTVKTEFLDTLNAPPCFAQHCDWRLPEVKAGQPFGGIRLDGSTPADTEELETIRLMPSACGVAGVTPCIDPIFGPTAAHFYWSSITFADNSFWAVWGVDFANGQKSSASKTQKRYVRAVRTGP